MMRLKLITAKKGDHFERLEVQVNEWLAEHPSINVRHVHRMSQPGFGWGHLAIGIWYSED